MIEGTFAPLRLRVLVVDDELTHDTAEGRAARLLVKDLESRNLDVVQAISAADGMAVVTSDASIHCCADGLDARRRRCKNSRKSERAARLHPRPQREDSDLPDGGASEIRRSCRSRSCSRSMSSSGRSRTPRPSSAAASRQRRAAIIEQLLPPFVAALGRFARVHEYSWHTPGHAGGPAFQKSPVGRIFHDYFGENLLALGPVDQRRRARLAAGPHGTDRRVGEIRGARIRRAPDVLRDERHVDREPTDH